MTDQRRFPENQHSRGNRLTRRDVMRGVAAIGAATAATRVGGIATMAATRRAPGLIRAQNPVTIEVWDQQQSDKSILDAYNQALTTFQKENPDITVKVTTFPYAQYRDKLLVAVQGGSGPDIMALDEVWTPEFGASGAIQPLDDLISKSSAIKPDLFFSGAWDTNKYDGKIWGIPLNFDVWEQLYLNADAFKAAGLDAENPPKTWDDWLAAAEKLTTAPKQFGIGIIGHKGEDTVVMLNSLMYSNGGSVIDDSGKVVIDSPENVATLKFFQSLAKSAPEGVANADEAANAAAFTAGQVTMVLDGSWQQDSFSQQAKFNWTIAVPPAPDGKSFVGALGGWNYAISQGSKAPDAAFKLIEYLSTNKDVQKTINSLTPALKAAGEEFVKEKRKQPDVILETLNSGRPRPISPVYPQVSSAEQDMVQAIWAGTSVEDALKTAQSAIEQLVQS
jgi:multiple sugar transport system substrate-binding protein